jgi:magnesium-transporting ATPase (P-type)
MAPVTLAIGDGANDVPMIQEAQIGIGISGKEGAQAANSADFSIAQFKHLKRLLLLHGRWNYRRAAKVVLYSFYKNIVSTLCLVIFMYPSFMSGLCLFEEWMFNAYNMVLLLPILVVGFLDKDLREQTIVKYPALYASGRLKLDLNIRRMLGSSLLAVAHAAIIMGLPLATVSGGLVRGADGVDGAGVWVVGTMIYCALLVAMALRAVLLSNSISAAMVLAVAMSLGAFVLVLVLYSGTDVAFLLDPFTTGGYYHVVYHAVTLPTTWLLLLLVPATCALLEILIAHVATEILPPDAIRYGIEHDRGFHGTGRPLWRRRSCASIARRVLLCGDGGLFDPVEAHKAGAFVASAIGAKLQIDEGALQRGSAAFAAPARGGAANRIAALSRQFSTEDDIGMMRSSSAFTIAAEGGSYGSDDDA